VTPTEYVLRTLQLRADFRASNRLLAFLLEIGRGAAGAALVLAVADLAGLAPFAPTARARFVWIMALAVAIALSDLVRARAIGPQPTHG
jgi:hypothetical protein